MPAIQGKKGDQVWVDEYSWAINSEMDLMNKILESDASKFLDSTATSAPALGIASGGNRATSIFDDKKKQPENSWVELQNLIQTEVLKAANKMLDSITKVIAERDARIDELSNRIVDLEQKIEFLIAVENNENFGKF